MTLSPIGAAPDSLSVSQDELESPSLMTGGREKGSGLSQSQPGCAASLATSGSARSAALRLARRTLEYVGWLDGTFDKSGLMDADDEMKDLALAVYAELGETPPMKVNRRKGKQP